VEKNLLLFVPQSFVRAFKNILAIAVATDITFRQAEEIKNILENPEAFAAAAAAVVQDAPRSIEAPKEVAKGKDDEEEGEESEGDMGFGLFD